MTENTISISAVNVELSEEKRVHIIRHLAPLKRLLAVPERVHIDVVLRAIRRPLSGTTYCVMVRMTEHEQTYYSVAMSHYFDRAIRSVRDDLRSSISRSYEPDTQAVNYLRQKAHERYFVELFV